MSKIIIGRDYPVELIARVKDAKSEIKIIIYEWRWYENEIGTKIQIFNNEIINARNRGVKIDAIVNNDHVSDKLQNEKINIRQTNSKKVMHIKMVLIDNKYLFLGSHNLTKNAFELNHEISVLIEDPDSINKCNNFFKMAWAL